MCDNCHGEQSNVWLLDASPYMTRGNCGDFPPWLIDSWIGVSVLLFVAYLSIAAILLDFARRSRRHAYPFNTAPRWPMLAFAAFFVGCGGGHLLNAVSFIWPAYRFYILWDAFTLSASLAGLLGLIVLVRWVINQIVMVSRDYDDFTVIAPKLRVPHDDPTYERLERVRLSLERAVAS